MTYRYNTRIQLSLNIGNKVGHMYDKAHAQQQQQQRRVTQTFHRTIDATITAYFMMIYNFKVISIL